MVWTPAEDNEEKKKSCIISITRKLASNEIFKKWWEGLVLKHTEIFKKWWEIIVHKYINVE